MVAVLHTLQHCCINYLRRYTTLLHILEICLQLGVRTVTVFAFSLDNFKRSKNEIDSLIDLAETKLSELAHRRHFLVETQTQVRFLGDISRLPTELQNRIEYLQNLTTFHNSERQFNICIAYSSVAEMYHAFQCCCATPNATSVTQHLFTSSNYPQLIVRTSGERRLSDFLLMQAAHANSSILFIDKLWPAITIWDIISILFQYQG
uniref:Alkyl transferase n=1 Tax=Lygus hesperus TaxID=30085 RepID=A0A0A9XSR6_LYGHE